jgi:V/A-type H+/Na+-transporting ATPase subunit I
MIVPMLKYSFLVYHKEFNDFLIKLQDLGVVHIIEKKIEANETLTKSLALITKIKDAVKFLEKRKVDKSIEGLTLTKKGMELFVEVQQTRADLEKLNQLKVQLFKELDSLEKWGDFEPSIVEKLNRNDVDLKLFSCSINNFEDEWRTNYFIEEVATENEIVYFAVFFIKGQEPDIEADEFKIPRCSLSALKKEIDETKKNIVAIEAKCDEYAKNAIDVLKAFMHEQQIINSFGKVELIADKQAEEKIMFLEGWVPVNKDQELTNMLDNSSILYVKHAKSEISTAENIPVLLKNNRFAKLFEPIGNLFSLPNPSEIDLTPLFAPFFMMFFGFCLGDAGYGLLIVLGATLYKFKAKPDVKPYLTLAQFLGSATVLFGIISGTMFGVNLIEADIAILDNFRDKFFDSNQMFNLALIFGGIQIIFGMFVKAINLTRQHGFAYALATIGWLLLILGMLARFVLIHFNILPDTDKIMMYAVLISAGIMILFLNDPKANIFVRFGKGIWESYGMITGVFGDLLSYIRLFALGISSAILGLVINSIGMNMLGIPYIGPVLFIVFLAIGHLANILISSLGSFVHPMRLTFVEFYKNAGFSGGGKAYKPFTNKIKE